MNNNLFIFDGDSLSLFFEAAVAIAENSLPEFIRSYFIASDSSSIYYGNKDSIYKAVNERGHSVVWFEGPNSDSFCISPDYFNLDDLSGLDNQDMYFLTIYVGIQNSIIDTNTNLTREMLVMQNSGSLAGIVFVGRSFWWNGIVFQNEWAQRLFDPTIPSIGESFYLDYFFPGGLFGYMKKVTNLWADPSLKLKYDVTVDVEDVKTELPTDFNLYQNYPNPFNPSTKIKFVIPKSSFVNLKVYNVLGKEAATLVNEERPAGTYEVEFNGTGLPSGVYFYRLRAGDFVQTKKMMLMK